MRTPRKGAVSARLVNESRRGAAKKRSKKKGKKRSRGTRFKLPKKNGYIWQLLQSMTQDILDQSFCRPLTPFFLGKIENLLPVIRYQDIKRYLEWCDTCSLTQVNVHYVGTDVQDDNHLFEIRCLRLLTFAAKYDFEDSPFDTEANALEAFLAYEDRCRNTNNLPVFQLFHRKVKHNRYVSYVVHPVLAFAEEFIHKVVGGIHLTLAEILSANRHGPGATAGKSGQSALPIYKYHPPIDCTPKILGLVVAAIGCDQRWSRSLRQYARRQHPSTQVNQLLKKGYTSFDLARHVVCARLTSRIMFVPKNAVTRRTICAEPTANMMFQLAIDELIRNMLKKYGIDLDTQEKNQLLAKDGSITSETDTLDLKGASDCIAKVWLKLFPDQMADLLRLLRTEFGTLPDGSLVEYEKLAAMGNGYTFVIESLIFAALIYGVAKVNGYGWQEINQSTAVYGDDLIVPKVLTSDLCNVLEAVGFSLNREKSFTFGPVRESCGTDYINGHLISRPTIKSKPTHEWELFRDHNLLYLLSLDYSIELNSTLGLIKSWIPRRHYGPIDRDRIYAWLFSEEPIAEGKRILPSTSCKEALYWQVPVYKLKTFVVGLREEHPNQRLLDEQCFRPMMYLTSAFGETPWWKTNDGFQIKTKADPKNDDRWFYKKRHRVVRMSMTYLPECYWRVKQPQPLLEI